MATWLRHLATGTLLTTLALGCKFGEVDDDDGFDDDDTGSSGRAGARAGGAGGASARAGAGGSRAGSTASGGARAGAGGSPAGSGGTPVNDDVPADVSCDDPKGKRPALSCEFEDPLPEDEACLTCLSQQCCDELKDCYATEPHDRCGYGRTSDEQEEYQCYMDCLVDHARQNDKFYTNDDQDECAVECGIAVDGSGAECSLALIGNRTNDLMNCMHNQCESECLQERIDAP